MAESYENPDRFLTVQTNCEDLSAALVFIAIEGEQFNDLPTVHLHPMASRNDEGDVVFVYQATIQGRVDGKPHTHEPITEEPV